VYSGVYRPSVLHTTANTTSWAVIRYGGGPWGGYGGYPYGGYGAPYGYPCAAPAAPAGEAK
jgi:hypothetical protein